MYFRRCFLLLLLLTAPVIAGCSVKGRPVAVDSPYYPLDKLEEGSILHVPTGTLITKDQLFSYLFHLPIVYVGEIHDNLEHHKVQLDVIRTMFERYPGKIAVGMEMFRTSSQTDLDRWVDGEMDEKEFYKVWHRNWGIDYEYYRDILEYVRDKKIPILALNASKELIRAVVHRGVEEVDEDVKELLPEMDESDRFHRAMVRAVFGDPSHKGMDFDQFYRIQLLWEETMSRRIADYMRDADDNERIVVLTGGGHINYGFGIPKRVFRRFPEPYVTVLLMAPKVVGNIEQVREKEIELLKVQLPTVPLHVADFVWSTGYETLAGKRPKLGVHLKEGEGRMRVISVKKGSAAEKGGIKEGDIIEDLDGEPVKEFSDLTYLLGLKNMGDETTLGIFREGKRYRIKVYFEKEEGKE